MAIFARRSVFIAGVSATVVAMGAGAAFLTVDRSSAPGDGGRTSSTSARDTTTVSPTLPSGACTIADIKAPGDAPMPTPEVVTHHIGFQSGVFAQIDPPSTTQPAITAAVAWQNANKFPHLSPLGTYAMMLGNVSSLGAGGNRLAWLIVGHHVPFVGSGGPVAVSRDGTSVSRPPSPPCDFVDTLQPVDATTGHVMFFEAGGLGRLPEGSNG